MVIVPLSFLPPLDEDIVALHIYESDSASGDFQEIESVTNIGGFPNYIDTYTTSNATNENDWFAIQWENSSGAFSDISAPVKGDTKTVVGEIVDRVLLRDSSLNENVVAQEAEYAVYLVFRTDPYSVDTTNVNYIQWSGLTDLVMATSKYQSLIESSSFNDYTAGIISEKSGSVNQVSKAILDLEQKALKKLGLKVSLVGQINSLGRACWQDEIVCFDFSRRLGVVAIRDVCLFSCD